MQKQADRLLMLVLRLAGVVQGLAVVPALMPRSWIAAVHEFIGFGPFPGGPIAEYLARSLSAFYAINGGLALVLSLDVRRHAAVITYMAIAMMAFGLLILATDLSVGMPWWWTLGEGPILMGFGFVLLALQRLARGPRGGEAGS